MSKNLTSILEPGNSVEIKYELRDGDILTLKSDVVEIHNEDYVAITNPIHEAKIYSIHNDKEIEVIVNKDNAGTHKFRAKVIDRYKKNNLLMLLLEKRGPIRYAQRRDYYRHSILLSLKIDIFTYEGILDETITAMTKDISGGGLRLVVKKKLKKGTLIRCNIPIEGEMVSPIGEIVRIDRMQDSTLLYDTAVSFTDILEKDRSKIISYIFKCQQKAR